MLNWEDHTESRVLPGGIPQSIVHQGGEIAEIQSALATAAESWDGERPLFLATGVLAWNLTPTDMATIADSLGPEFAVVRGDQYFALMRQAAGAGLGTPDATPITCPLPTRRRRHRTERRCQRRRLTSAPLIPRTRRR